MESPPADAPRSCYACLQQPSDFIPIADEVGPKAEPPSTAEPIGRTSSYRGDIIAKHFWFEKDDLMRGVICTSCWSKIEDFHQFYSEIEQAHEHKLGFTIVQIKQEDGVEVEEEEQEEIVVEPITAEEIEREEEEAELKREEVNVSETEEDDDDEEEEEEDDEFELEPDQPKRRKRIKKKGTKLAERMAKSDSLIAQFCKMFCDQCSQEFPNFSQLYAHCAAVHQRKPAVFCCDRKFNNRIRLYDHIQRHVDPDRFQCKHCKRVCLDRESLKRHTVMVHTPEEKRPFKCDRCPKSYTIQNEFIKHVKYHQAMDTKEFPCGQCDKFFGNAALLKQHNKNVHSTTYEFVCDTCAKGFNSRGLFTKHLKEHDPKVRAEKAQCPICFQWLLKVSLSKHVMRHNSGGPVRCDLCGKESPNLLALRSHKQFFHKEAKFGCSVCDKVFKRAISLKEHMATHSGAVLYTCPHCPKTFNSNANMHSHRKKMHPQEWLDAKMQRLTKHETKGEEGEGE
uniref:Transcription factor grauzone n=1 Tax=Culex pipiens TaxID=7175 RepID=A0A8D8MJF1_CULPI